MLKRRPKSKIERTCFRHMPSKMIQTQIQWLLMKVNLLSPT